VYVSQVVAEVSLAGGLCCYAESKLQEFSARNLANVLWVSYIQLQVFWQWRACKHSMEAFCDTVAMLMQALAKMELRVSPRLLDSLAAAALLKISEFNPQVRTYA
jgi:hypothetical protein